MGAALGLLGAICAMAPVTPGAGKAPILHRYWPLYPRPKTLVVVRDVPDRQAGMVLHTLAGLVAREASRGGSEMVWGDLDHPAYLLWRREMLKRTGAKAVTLPLWEAVRRARARGVVRGYILFRYDASDRPFHQLGEVDASANVATSLCASLGAIAVPEGLEETARARGLQRLLDVRGMTEEQCFEAYKARFSRKVLAMIDPKVQECRAEAVATGAFVMSREGPLYEKALARLEPDAPILGWGIGDERRLTEPSTRWGAFQTATNWCLNLPPLSTEAPGKGFTARSLQPRPARSIWGLKWEDDVHYAAFVMSDGDNVQWLMGNFLMGENSWWGSPDRGQAPIGWTICNTDLAQVCPYTLDYLRTTAKPADDFVLMTGGYLYPDLYGASRPSAGAMRTHASRMAPYMDLSGIQALSANFTEWESPAARRSCATMAEEMPGLEGILAFQYSPYTAGKGQAYWVRGAKREVPVVSARYAIWANSPFPNDGGPAQVADWLNAMPARGHVATEESFSWVIVHAWSYFKPGAAGGAPEPALGTEPGSARGMAPVVWTAQRLQPHVRLLGPTDLLLMVRLRLRSAETLASALVALGKQISARPTTVATRASSASLTEARARLAAGAYRECFEAGKRAAALLSGPAPQTTSVPQDGVARSRGAAGVRVGSGQVAPARPSRSAPSHLRPVGRHPGRGRSAAP
jgi:hypothetical protein